MVRKISRCLFLWLVCFGVANASEDEPTGFGLNEASTAPPSAAKTPGTLRSSAFGIAPAELVNLVRQVSKEPLDVRLDRISHFFLSQPYLVDPLGEGQLPDADPLTRYDRFDCLTYVEEVLALSQTSSLAHASSLRTILRYGHGDDATYADRNHFMTMQWVPDAIDAGILEDITNQFDEATYRERVVSIDTWHKWGPAKRFKMPMSSFPTGKMALAHVPIDAMLKQLDKIPNGAILLVVRKDLPHKPLWVSHIGFVIQKERTVFRHASKLGTGSVRDNSLEWYLTHLKNYKFWPAIGVTILRPIEVGPRRSRLTSEQGQ